MEGKKRVELRLEPLVFSSLRGEAFAKQVSIPALAATYVVIGMRMVQLYQRGGTGEQCLNLLQILTSPAI